MIPHVEAEKLSGDIDRYLCGEQSSVNPKELQKLEESIYFYHKHKAKIRQAIKDFVVPDYEIEDLDKNYKKFKQDYNKTLKSYSADLENFYNKHSVKSLKDTKTSKLLSKSRTKNWKKSGALENLNPLNPAKKFPILQFVVKKMLKILKNHLWMKKAFIFKIQNFV